MAASGTRGSIGKASYEAVRKHIDEGKKATEAFRLVAQETGPLDGDGADGVLPRSSIASGRRRRAAAAAQEDRGQAAPAKSHRRRQASPRVAAARPRAQQPPPPRPPRRAS